MDDRVSLMACCNGMARCMANAQRVDEALDWLEEVNILDKHVRLSTRPALLDWVDNHPEPARLDFVVQRITGLCHAADIFLNLGNTASAVYRRVTADEIILWYYQSTSLDTRPLRDILSVRAAKELLKYRNPDPDTLARTKLSQPSLQVRGSWQKIKVPKAASISHRTGVASFIHKSRLYVAGGHKSGSFEQLRDLWCMDLQKLDGWCQLASYPAARGNAVLGWHMVVHEDKAYLFCGQPTLDYFDLVTERWGELRTVLVGADGKRTPWPYARYQATDYTMQLVRGQLYVFAGAVKECMLGCNLLMVLDLQTRTWTWLAGSLGEPKADYTCPGPRMSLASWVDARQDRVYVLYGMADRLAAMIHHQPHSSQDSHTQDDCWSWGIRERAWRRERMVGNAPCPRAEFPCAYNASLNATVLFGGYNPNVPTDSDNPATAAGFSFSYYADTFMLDHAVPTPTWKHVIAHGFPTYRAGAHLLADPDTGRMFLFGGYTNTMFVPSGRHEMTRSFGDLWQLRLDVPGGFFEEVDWADEERTALVGPWQKCFACGSTGPWKKCGGESAMAGAE
ncbi:hypothetical protein B0H21DRAFT_756421 [Amylocystis lapponica]|nr:hypothetical protein B0H21DRAFT_756421 [Amylocystis lapponica]